MSVEDQKVEIKIERRGFSVSEEDRFSVPVSEDDARLFVERINRKINEILSSWDDKYLLIEMQIIIKNVPDRERNPNSDKVFAVIFAKRCLASVPRTIVNISLESEVKNSESTFDLCQKSLKHLRAFKPPRKP